MKRIALLFAALAIVCTASLAQVIAPVGKVLSIDSENYYIHVVNEGESAASIAQQYETTESSIFDANESLGWSGVAKEGDVLRIPCKKRVRDLRPDRDSSEYIYYTLTSGETLFGVAIDFAISLDAIIEDNPTLDLTNVPAFSTLLIRHDAVRQTTLEVLGAESREYAALLNRLSEEYDYFVVEKGQTLYSLSRSRGVSVATLKAANGNPELLYVGQLLKTPRAEKRGVVSVAEEVIEVKTISEPSPEEPIVEEREEKVEENVQKEEVIAQERRPKSDGFSLYEFFRGLITARSEGVPYESFLGRKLNISMMLPLTNEAGLVRGSFVEFYQGALIAAEDMKAKGYTVNIKLYDTHNSADHVRRLVAYDPDIDDTDLFIGPIYERNAAAVMEYAQRNDIPVVSPLATSVSGSYGDDYFCMAPAEERKFDKIRGLITPNSKVTVVYTQSVNREMEQSVLSMLEGVPYKKVVYNDEFEVASEEAETLQTAMERRGNLVFVLSDSEMEVDRVLAMIASVVNKFGGKGSGVVKVVGDASWTRYKNIDRNLFFKLGVCYVTSYHTDRTMAQVLDFDAKYIHSFGRMPSTFSYRAYDAVMIFSTAILSGRDLHEGLETIAEPYLRTPYHFSLQGGNMVNDFWPLVQYSGDKIKVE